MLTLNILFKYQYCFSKLGHIKVFIAWASNLGTLTHPELIFVQLDQRLKDSCKWEKNFIVNKDSSLGCYAHYRMDTFLRPVWFTSGRQEKRQKMRITNCLHFLRLYWHHNKISKLTILNHFWLIYISYS